MAIRRPSLAQEAALQLALLKDRRKAKEVTAAQLLANVHLHGCVRYFFAQDESNAYVDALNAEAAILCEVLGVEVDGTPLSELVYCACSIERAYERVQYLDDDMLDRLTAFLTALHVGQENCFTLDTRRTSFMNVLASDLEVSLKGQWMPDQWFLSRRTMAELAVILKETGMSRLFGNGKGYKKTELVPLMVNYIQKLRGMETLKDDQIKARDWLPQALNFPADEPEVEAPETDAETAIEAFAEAA